ncbi:hypothetical protein MNAN1_002759 [Malassezia nana]|uniref:SPT2 chromatin protein n=1 Tax=Malassezia nana TaxID=180528 RepID=A0AAF0EL29_9BASI|nr:hypothetical protein MNAN1_002759 [Malassezia nana]
MGLSFEELKREALQKSSQQREELHEKIQQQAQKRSEAQRAAHERQQQRAAWAAREQQRLAERQAQEKKRDMERKAEEAKRLAAARRAEKAEMDKARGRPPPRAKALDHAHAEAAKRRLQVPRMSSSVALTREEKRMKRMAKDMGVKFRPETKPPMRRAMPHAPGASAPLAKRPMTPREHFIMEERQRKEARKEASPPSSPDASEPYDSDQSDAVSDKGTASHASIREQIWQMFGRNRERYAFMLIFSYIARDVDSDEDDMEAGASAVLKEEQRSSLYGRREDEREERRLLELKRRKMQNVKP